MKKPIILYDVYKQRCDSYELVISELTKKQALELVEYLSNIPMNFEIYKIFQNKID
jgi:hypothetical protein